jgi:hypothetical protein
MARSSDHETHRNDVLSSSRHVRQSARSAASGAYMRDLEKTALGMLQQVHYLSKN